MKRFLIAVVVALSVTAGLRAEILEQILVKVNGEILTKTDLEKLQIAAIRDRAGAAAPTNDAELGKAIADVTPAVIVDAVDELLLLQRAKTIGLAVTDEQFNGVLDSIKKDNKIESEQAFQAALKDSGMTLPQLRKMLEKNILISQVRQREVLTHVDISEAEEKAYYEAHKGEFASVPSVTLREIKVTVPTDGRYELLIRYRTGPADRAEILSVNGVERGIGFSMSAGLKQKYRIVRAAIVRVPTR